jgi:hypothetical protein
MTEEVIQVWNIKVLEDMMDAIIDVEQTVDLRGSHSSIVYPNMHRVELVEETLTDGSKVLHLHFSEAPLSLP